MVKKPRDEFEQKKEIMDLQERYDLDKHKRMMDELKYRRESEAIHHNHEQERGRIKSAEIRKMQERKELAKMGGRY